MADEMKKYTIGRTHSRNRRSAFTLVEIMVALAIMMLLLAIILVPVNMALNVFHIGKARNEVKQANQVMLNQLAAELRQAVFVFPNEKMPGITDKSPYTNNNQFPYYDTATSAGVSNTARIDILLPAKNTNGSITTPLRSSNYIVTYYARRLNPKQADGITDNPYDAYSNPIVLFRAQYPFKQDDSTAFAAYTATNSNSTNSRYPIGGSPYAGKVWLTQNGNSEPNLEALCDYSGVTSAANHTLVTPRDMGLVAPNALDTAPSYQPDSSFTCDDTNDDGKIDRVTVNVNMAKYDALGADQKNQKVRLSQTIDLPNVK
jgi:type II secretory pathway pseudopilin PulG